MKIINGKLKISVSDILNYYYPMDLNISDEILKKAGKRGEIIHKLIEQKLKNNKNNLGEYLFEFDEKDYKIINNQFNSFLEFEKNNIFPKKFKTETKLETKKTRGIIDYYDENQIVDWKTNSIIKDDELQKYKLQMNLYHYLLKKNGLKPPKKLNLIHLKKNKTRNFYKIYSFDLINENELEIKINEAYGYYSNALIENWYERRRNV